MMVGFERCFAAAARGLVGRAARRPAQVLAACVVATLACSYLAATRLSVDTDSDRLLSRDLPVRQTNLALAQAFPALQHNLVLLIEADDPSDARDAARELASRLRQEPERYPGVFLPGDGPFYEEFGLFYLERDSLEALAERTERAGPLLVALAERPELSVLLGSLARAVESADGPASLGPEAGEFLDRARVAIDDFVDGRDAELGWEAWFAAPGPESQRRQLLFVRPEGELTELGPVLDAIAGIRALAQELRARPGLRVRVTGDRAVHSEEMSLVIGEAIVSGTASLLLVTGLLYICLRSGRLTIGAVSTLLVGLVWTGGIAALLVGQLNALTSAFAVVYIGLAVDFGIHFGLGYLESGSRDGSGFVARLEDTGSRVGSALVFCALTTAIGFYAFIPTSYRAVAEMGIISGSGVFLGLLATLTFYPALIALGLGPASAPYAEGRAAGGRVSPPALRLPAFPTRYPRSVCAVALVFTGACALSLAWVRFDVNTLNVRDPRVESVQALRDLVADPESSVWTIEVLTGNLEEAEEVATRLEALPGVDHVNTAMRFLPERQQESLALFEEMRAALDPLQLSADLVSDGDEDPVEVLGLAIDGYSVALDIDAELRGGEGDEEPVVLAAESLRESLLRLRDTLSAEGKLLALESQLFSELPGFVALLRDVLPDRQIGLSDLPADLLDRYLAPDGRARVEVFSASSLQEAGDLERFSDLIHAVRPDAGGPAAGTVALGRAIVASLQEALVTAVCVIALLLLLLFRSLKMAAVTLTPLLVGALATAGYTVLFDSPFNFANVIVLPLILGIGVDSGIHLVNRYRRGDGAGLLETTTATAVLFSALTTAVSFATLALSNHLGIASLAQLLSAGVLLMLAANLLVLPAILAWMDS